MNHVNLNFGNTAATRPSRQGQPHRNGQGQHGSRTNAPPVPEPDAVALAISKAVRQLLFITRSYALTLCDASIDDLKADLEVMLRHNDLSSIRLELLGADGKVLVEFLLTFNGLDGNGRGIIDTGRGIELPMFDRSLVKGKRLVIQQNGLDAAYKHLLRIPWHKAHNIPKAEGAAYETTMRQRSGWTAVREVSRRRRRPAPIRHHPDRQQGLWFRQRPGCGPRRCLRAGQAVAGGGRVRRGHAFHRTPGANASRFSSPYG